MADAITGETNKDRAKLARELLAMLAGSVLGGILGERWHGKLPRPVHTETRTVADRADSRDPNQTQTDGGGASRIDPPRS